MGLVCFGGENEPLESYLKQVSAVAFYCEVGTAVIKYEVLVSINQC